MRRKKIVNKRINRNQRTVRKIFTCIILLTVFVAFLKIKIMEVHIQEPKRDYHSYVTKYSKVYDVPEDIIFAVIKTESNFEKDAESSVGACGLMQIMPETFKWLQAKLDEKLDEKLDDSKIFDPSINIKYGTYYLSMLHTMFPDWETVYAAYNAGPNKVKTWLQDHEISSDGKLINIPYEETASYVVKVNRARQEYLDT